MAKEKWLKRYKGWQKAVLYTIRKYKFSVA